MHHVVVYFLLAAFAQGQTKQEAMNRAMRQQFEARFAFYSDSRTDAYLRRIADRLHAPASSEIRVVVDREAWANVVPGGHYYVSTELLGRLEDESELAAIIAHLAEHPGDAFKLIGALNSTPLVWTHDGGLCAKFTKSLKSLLPLSVQDQTKAVEKEATSQAAERLLQSNYDTAGLAQLFPEHDVQPVNRPGTIVSTEGFAEMQSRLPMLEKPAVVPSLYYRRQR